jgi:hypothetical protein
MSSRRLSRSLISQETLRRTLVAVQRLVVVYVTLKDALRERGHRRISETPSVESTQPARIHLEFMLTKQLLTAMMDVSDR